MTSISGIHSITLLNILFIIYIYISIQYSLCERSCLNNHNFTYKFTFLLLPLHCYLYHSNLTYLCHCYLYHSNLTYLCDCNSCFSRKRVALLRGKTFQSKKSFKVFYNFRSNFWEPNFRDLVWKQEIFNSIYFQPSNRGSLWGLAGYLANRIKGKKSSQQKKTLSAAFKWFQKGKYWKIYSMAKIM